MQRKRIAAGAGSISVQDSNGEHSHVAQDHIESQDIIKYKQLKALKLNLMAWIWRSINQFPLALMAKLHSAKTVGQRIRCG